MNAGIVPRSNNALSNPASVIVIPIVAVPKALPKGRVQIPLEVREKLDLKPGTKMIVVAVEDAVVLQRVEALFTKESPRGTLKKIRTMFSKVPMESTEDIPVRNFAERHEFGNRPRRPKNIHKTDGRGKNIHNDPLSIRDSFPKIAPEKNGFVARECDRN